MFQNVLTAYWSLFNYQRQVSSNKYRLDPAPLFKTNTISIIPRPSFPVFFPKAMQKGSPKWGKEHKPFSSEMVYWAGWSFRIPMTWSPTKEQTKTDGLLQPAKSIPVPGRALLLESTMPAEHHCLTFWLWHGFGCLRSQRF